MIRGWANGCRCNVWGGQMCVDEMIRGGQKCVDLMIRGGQMCVDVMIRGLANVCRRND